MRSNRKILLVEDDQVDIMTVERAFNQLKITNELVVKTNGVDALAFLKSATGKDFPCLILLDINMPKMNGLEFLKIIKNDEKLCMIPVVMLTTSKADVDKVTSFQHGVAGYMLKPVDYKQFIKVVQTIDLYWTLSEQPMEE